jgi:glyoxylate reductase
VTTCAVAPNVVWLGRYPCSPEVETHALAQLGSILRFDTAEVLAQQWGPLGASPLPIAGLLCGIHHPLPSSTLALLRGLRVISNYGAGLNHLPLAWCAEHGIAVYNTPDGLTEATADIAWLLMLMVTREVLQARQHLLAGAFTGWHPEAYVAPGIQGHTLGLVGCGRIGQAVARRAQASGLVGVRYWQRHRLPVATEVALGLTYAARLEALLATSSLVSLHCPLTPDTQHLLSAERLALLPRGAVIVNTARGALIDELALVNALTSGALAGAGLDVYEHEPAVAPELLTLPQVVCLPHIGSATHGTRRAMGDAALTNLVAGLSEL